jgi:DNA repair protein RecN (Recombination protein N)
VQEAIQILDEGTPETPSVTDLIGQVTGLLNNLIRLDPTQVRLGERSHDAFDELAELTTALHAYQETIEFNPKRLDQVEERLNLIQNLKRKYGENIETVLTFAQLARKQLDSITHASERIVELEDEENRLLEKLGEIGQTLSEHRHQAAKRLEKTLEAELEHLSLVDARFKVDFSQRLSDNGVSLKDGRRDLFDAVDLISTVFVAPIWED